MWYTGLDVHMLELLFKFTMDYKQKAKAADHIKFCAALKPSKRDNTHKIRTKDGNTEWVPQVGACLSLLGSLRNILEHGFAGTNATAKMPDAAAREYTRWQLLDELCRASLTFLESIGFDDSSFPEHARYQQFHADCQAAAKLSAHFANPIAPEPQPLRFTVPTSSLDHGSHFLRLSPSFFGRELEMHALQQQLAQERCRVLILGGAGYGT
jgi:hypothetical protein